MKIHDVKILLDKEFYLAGEKVTGKLMVKTKNENWKEEGIFLTNETLFKQIFTKIFIGKAFVKLFDKLDIEWVEDEMISVGVTKRGYTNFQKPYQLNIEKFFDKNNVSITSPNDNQGDYILNYPLEFDLPEDLLGTQNVRNAKNQYFIKAYLTNDESIAKHYQKGVNVFNEFFKSLNHTYTAHEVIIRKQVADLPQNNNEERLFEAKSSHFKVRVSLPKQVYHRGEKIQVNLIIEHTDENKHALSLHKIGLKFFQVLKLKALNPVERVRLFEHLISHSSHKNVTQNTENSIVVEEFIEIPKDIPSSSSRSDTTKMKTNPIRVNYKISLQFWRNIMFDELDINIPVLVDPEL